MAQPAERVPSTEGLAPHDGYARYEVVLPRMPFYEALPPGDDNPESRSLENLESTKFRWDFEHS